jgi:hypothetical protein
MIPVVGHPKQVGKLVLAKAHALAVHHQEEEGAQIQAQSSDQVELDEPVYEKALPVPEPANPRPHYHWRTRHLSAPNPQLDHLSRRHRTARSSLNQKCSIAIFSLKLACYTLLGERREMNEQSSSLDGHSVCLSSFSFNGSRNVPASE